ncbi:MAG: hypothetical protein HMLKMBBP_02133 [Planctomycetes bacterium]|nr:hypothetical protein [Planctomycetota bacterium]
MRTDGAKRRMTMSGAHATLILALAHGACGNPSKEPDRAPRPRSSTTTCSSGPEPADRPRAGSANLISPTALTGLYDELTEELKRSGLLVDLDNVYRDDERTRERDEILVTAAARRLRAIGGISWTSEIPDWHPDLADDPAVAHAVAHLDPAWGEVARAVGDASAIQFITMGSTQVAEWQPELLAGWVCVYWAYVGAAAQPGSEVRMRATEQLILLGNKFRANFLAGFVRGTIVPMDRACDLLQVALGDPERPATYDSVIAAGLGVDLRSALVRALMAERATVVADGRSGTLGGMRLVGRLLNTEIRGVGDEQLVEGVRGYCRAVSALVAAVKEDTDWCWRGAMVAIETECARSATRVAWWNDELPAPESGTIEVLRIAHEKAAVIAIRSRLALLALRVAEHGRTRGRLPQSIHEIESPVLSSAVREACASSDEFEYEVEAGVARIRLRAERMRQLESRMAHIDPAELQRQFEWEVRIW